MISIFFTGLGPGGLRIAHRFALGSVCIPGSSHGGIAVVKGGNRLYSDQVYDRQNAVSLLGGSGGEITFTLCSVSRVLRFLPWVSYNIRVAHKPITTLRRLLTHVEDKDKSEDRQGAVYKIKCCDCQVSYICESGRNLGKRLTEDKRGTRKVDVNNHFAEHHLQTKHQIDWDSATGTTYSTDYYQRPTLESWVTNLDQTPLNRSEQLLAP